MIQEPPRITAGEQAPGDSDIGLRLSSLWRWETWLSVGITVALLCFLATQIDFNMVWVHLAACSKVYVLLGLLAHYATYPVRGLRWRRTMGMGKDAVGASKFGLVVFFYNAVDNVVPAKLGDLYAAHMARLNFQIRRSAALGSIAFLRMIDAWTVLLLAALASWLVFSVRIPNGVIWVLGGGFLLAMAITGCLLAVVRLKKNAPAWLSGRIAEMIEAFHGTIWPARKDRLPIAGLTAVIWILEILWMFCLVSAFGSKLSLAEIVFLTQIPLLASAFPLTPSGAGAVEITLYGCLRLVAVPHPLAVSITVLNRLIDYWLHIVLGVMMWRFRRRLGLRALREARVDESPSQI